MLFNNLQDVYTESKELMSAERKKQLTNRLATISADLNNADNLDKFLDANVKSKGFIPRNLVKIKSPKCYVWFNIKILGGFFVTFYLIGILELIGIMNALKVEIKDSFIFNMNQKNKTIDFYEIYIQNNQKIPDFSLFFITSIFSDIIINSIGYSFTSIIVLILNCSIIYFGLLNFHFLIGEELNQKYTFNQFIYLLILYILYYLLLGLIVLIPHNILKESFLAYDWHISLKELKKSGHNQEEKSKKLYLPMNGKFFVYLFSIIASAGFKIYLDKTFLVENIRINKFENKKNKNFILIIIFISGISIISSVIFYELSSCFICDKNNDDNDENNNYNKEGNNKGDNKKEDENKIYFKKKISSKAIKIFGYLIYMESNKPEKKICCHDCKVSMKKCSYCCGCYQRDCFKCCCKIDNDASETHMNKEKVCIIYKVSGLCSWFFALITRPEIFLFVILIYCLEIINVGFRLDLDDYLEKKEDDTIINYISLASQFILYFINFIFGLTCYSCKIITFISFFLNDQNSEYIEKKNEINIMIFGLLLIFFGGFFISSFLSFLIYFQFINNDLKYYLITFSIQICEYAKVLILYFADLSPDKFELLSLSFAISFYLFILDILKFIIEISNIKIENLILCQFIIGIILSVAFLFIMIIFIIVINKTKEIDDLFENLTSLINIEINSVKQQISNSDGDLELIPINEVNEE